MSTISVLGSVNIDLVVKVPSLPRPGDTVLGDKLLSVGGGKGANQAAAAARLAQRAGSVIVTLGERGALLRSRAGASHIEAFSVKAVDTTAAGDAFVGGVAAGLSFGLPIGDAARLGSAAGAAAATKVGARDSLPYPDDLKRMFGIDMAAWRARGRR